MLMYAESRYIVPLSFSQGYRCDSKIMNSVLYSRISLRRYSLSPAVMFFERYSILSLNGLIDCIGSFLPTKVLLTVPAIS